MEIGRGVSANTASRSLPPWDFFELTNLNSTNLAPTEPTPPQLLFSCSPISDRNTVVPAPMDHTLNHYPPQRQHLSSNSSHNNSFSYFKLGKRQNDGGAAIFSSAAGKRAAAGPAAVPRCQVDGCQKILFDEKEYHRRHKVCQLHSKAPKVMVLGCYQRFCQQCSRFHVLTEFDESKRSCRRRLAGHNERRRKSSTSNESIVIRNSCLESTLKVGKVPYLPSSPGRAFSLLSSNSSWVSASELSSTSSAALRELIAENRAAFLTQKQFSDQCCWNNTSLVGQIPSRHQQHHMTSQQQPQLDIGWGQFQEAGSHVTLDLMQTTDSLEFLTGRRKSKEKEDCREIWKSLEEAQML